MARLFHVISVANRASILAHGLDWTRMGAAISPHPGRRLLCITDDRLARLCS